MTPKLKDASPKTGLLGELEVELQLAKIGWHPVRLDTAQMASNTDLIAIKGKKRVSIQVKATDLAKQRDGSEWLGFGYATSYLRDRNKIFNSKKSPLVADVIVGVGYKENASRFIVMPVAFAEKLCRLNARFWYGVPAKKRDTGKLGKRSHSFPNYLCFTATRKVHSKHHERIKRNLNNFENAWYLLEETVEKLHTPSAWPLTR
jgi:hypothetical protein